MKIVLNWSTIFFTLSNVVIFFIFFIFFNKNKNTIVLEMLKFKHIFEIVAGLLQMNVNVDIQAK